MLLGIPRGHFFYDYKRFIEEIFANTDVRLVFGKENDEKILYRGIKATIDEACVPVKLVAGQVEWLADRTDRVLIPRIMKDFRGRWLCPKLLGLPEMCSAVKNRDKLLVTDPIYFNDRKRTKNIFGKLCVDMGIGRKYFRDNFKRAYDIQQGIACGHISSYKETSWEFVPNAPGKDEIMLPATKRVFLAGHPYNVYDSFFNKDIIRKLYELGIETVTEKNVERKEMEKAVADSKFIKAPFWEAFVRSFGSAVCLKKEVDGIIYLSSFSCGTDSFISEMIRIYISDVPVMVLKFDGQKGAAGYETRLEAFSDLLERRKIS